MHVRICLKTRKLWSNDFIFNFTVGVMDAKFNRSHIFLVVKWLTTQ